jgi:hypothetical protein
MYKGKNILINKTPTFDALSIMFISLFMFYKFDIIDIAQPIM